MGLLDKLKGKDEEPVDRATEDLARYRYLVRTAPLEVLRRCVGEARAPESGIAELSAALATVPESQDITAQADEEVRERLLRAVAPEGDGAATAGAVVRTMSASAALSGFLHSPEAQEVGLQAPPDAATNADAEGEDPRIKGISGFGGGRFG